MQKEFYLLAVGVVIVVVELFLLKIVVPSLVNMHNDGALIAALLVGLVAIAAPFAAYIWVVKPLISDGDNE